jgi:hypothetical protein
MTTPQNKIEIFGPKSDGSCLRIGRPRPLTQKPQPSKILSPARSYRAGFIW